MTIYRLVGILFIFIGLGFQLFGIYGMMKYKHFYIRLSISSLIDTAGVIAIFIGFIFYTGLSYASLKIGFILFLVLLLNPLSNHILGRGAYLSNYHPERQEQK